MLEELDCTTMDNFVVKKVTMWVDCFVKLYKANGHTYNKLCTTVKVLLSLQDVTFYPALLEGALSDAECELFSLLTRFAGLRINNETASSSYHTTTQGTKVVVEAINGCGEFSIACHLDGKT